MNNLENSFQPIIETPASLPPKKNRSKVLLIVLALVIVLLCCLAAIVALLYFDPFDWGLLSRFSRVSDPIAEVAPVDTTAYASVSIQNVDPDKLQSLVSVFEDAYREYSDEPITLIDDMEEGINDSLEEFDITLEEDILPWIGGYVGFGLLDLELDRYGYPETANYFIAVEAKDGNAADDFLIKLTDGIAESWDVDIDTSTYQGTTIYIVDDPYEELAFARHGDLVIMADSEDSIEQVIDASKGDSLADDPVYTQVIRQLPKERLLTFYIPSKALTDLSQVAIPGMGLPDDVVADTYDSFSGIAFSMAIVDAGLQLDTVIAYAPDKITDSQREMLEATGGGDKAADQLPGDTLVYFSGQRLDLTWTNLYDTYDTSMGGDFEEALQELEDEIGFNIDTDLFAHLDGAYAIAVFPSDAGFLAEFAEVNIGFAFLTQTSDEGALLNTLEEFNRNFEDLGDVMIDETSTSDMTIYEASDYWSETPVLAYGVGSGWFGIATSKDILEAIPDPSNALSDDSGFRQAQNYLPSGMKVVGYIDFKDGLAEIRRNLSGYDREDFDEATFIMKPIEALIVGSSAFDGESVHSTVILVIPTEN